MTIDDMISRQAAIRILDAAWVDGTEYQGHLHERFEKLPSAQPVAKDTNVLNNDCISRQAAIEAFWRLSISIRPSVFEAITDMLKTLPSVQPEIIRCKDCKHRLNSLYCEAWNNSPGFPCIGDEMFCSMAERRTDEPDK